MGGWGSGRHDYATTPTVGGCYHLDADDLTEAVQYPGEACVRQWWGGREDPQAMLTVYLEAANHDADRAGYVRLESTVNDRYTGDTTQHSHPVPLEYTACNYGGSRPWFRCPGVVDGDRCGRRARKLYLPRGGEYWLCRECYDLGYTSSRTSGDRLTQAELRYKRAYAKADRLDRRPHPNSLEAPYDPERPKGMHHDTYEALLEDIREARREWDEALMRDLRDMRARLESFALAPF